jgi:hypothetical protein
MPRQPKRYTGILSRILFATKTRNMNLKRRPTKQSSPKKKKKVGRPKKRSTSQRGREKKRKRKYTKLFVGPLPMGVEKRKRVQVSKRIPKPPLFIGPLPKGVRSRKSYKPRKVKGFMPSYLSPEVFGLPSGYRERVAGVLVRHQILANPLGPQPVPSAPELESATSMHLATGYGNVIPVASTGGLMSVQPTPQSPVEIAALPPGQMFQAVSTTGGLMSVQPAAQVSLPQEVILAKHQTGKSKIEYLPYPEVALPPPAKMFSAPASLPTDIFGKSIPIKPDYEYMVREKPTKEERIPLSRPIFRSVGEDVATEMIRRKGELIKSRRKGVLWKSRAQGTEFEFVQPVTSPTAVVGILRSSEPEERLERKKKNKKKVHFQ